MREPDQLKLYELNPNILVDNKLAKVPPKLTPKGKFISSVYIGVEVEVENVSGHRPAAFADGSYAGWSLASDGSLRNGGAEFLFKNPARSNRAHERISTLVEWIRKYRSWELTERTSTHVHVDCRALTLAQIKATCATYALIEPLLFMYCTSLSPMHNREKSVFCVPWYRTPDDPANLAAQFSRLSNTHSLKEQRMIMKTIGNKQCKYTSVNSSSLYYFGSLEFRHAPVFKTLDGYVSWINAVQSIVMFGMKMGSADRVLFAYENFGPERFVRLVFRPSNVMSAPLDMREYIELADKVDVEDVAGKFMTEEAPTRPSWGEFDQVTMPRPADLAEEVQGVPLRYTPSGSHFDVDAAIRTIRTANLAAPDPLSNTAPRFEEYAQDYEYEDEDEVENEDDI